MAASPAATLLEAIHYVTEADLGSLQKLVGFNAEILNQELVLRILLTYLPESTDPATYAGFIADLVAGNFSALDEADLPGRSQQDLKEEDAKKKAQELQILPLHDYVAIPGASSDILTSFLLNRAHRIEAETGSLVLVQQLIEPFADHSRALKRWTACTLLPLLRLEYEHHPQDTEPYSLSAFESLRGELGLRSLLEEIGKRIGTSEKHSWEIDLKTVVAPWIYGQVLQGENKEDSDTGRHTNNNSDASEIVPSVGGLWASLDDWLLDLAKQDLKTAAGVVQQWEGPVDVDFGGWLESSVLDKEKATLHYQQTALAMLYLKNSEYDPSVWEKYNSIIQKIAQTVPLGEFPDLQDFGSTSDIPSIDEGYLKSISAVHTLPHELLDEGNPLTRPIPQSIVLAYHVLASSFLLSTLGDELSPDSVLGLSLHGFEADQRTRMQKILQLLARGATKTDNAWSEIRRKILWLRDWTSGEQSGNTRHGVFCRISYIEFEVEMLKTLVTAARFKLVQNLYFDGSSDSAPSEHQKQRAILDVAFHFYDNASNGNKTRGGIKKAADILSTFRPHFPQSVEFAQLHALIQATHALSFYALTLHHGVPFVPVNIRVHSDPLSLIEKVLGQNPRSYTKLDDLLRIGHNLVRSGLVKSLDRENLPRFRDEEATLVAVERHITARAISASLKEDDFDTAYSYIVNRLSPSQYMPQNGGSQEPSSNDAVLWQVAYEAGRYRPRNANESPGLRRLEQRMELLSQALLLAPPASLQKVLATWRGCEGEVNASLEQEREEEEVWNEKADRHLPGGFTGDDIVPTPHRPRDATRRAMDEETPMGLFDVARGAASAFSKSAFPLRGQAAGSSQRAVDAEQGAIAEQGERVRKRDMVSNMVTGGLASGIGWVIGAPQNRPE